VIDQDRAADDVVIRGWYGTVIIPAMGRRKQDGLPELAVAGSVTVMIVVVFNGFMRSADSVLLTMVAVDTNLLMVVVVRNNRVGQQNQVSEDQ